MSFSKFINHEEMMPVGCVYTFYDSFRIVEGYDSQLAALLDLVIIPNRVLIYHEDCSKQSNAEYATYPQYLFSGME